MTSGITDSDKKYIKIIGTVTTIIVLLFSAYHGLIYFIETHVDKYVKTTDFLKNMSDSVRPSVIFDQKGVVLVEMGAMKYLKEDIKVDTPPGDKFPRTITVLPSQHLPYPPLLSTTDPIVMGVAIEKLPGYGFVYTLDYGTFTELTKSIRYRLEILH